MQHRNRLRQRLFVWTTLLVVAALGMVAVPGAPFGATAGGAKVARGQELSQLRRVFMPLLKREMETQTGVINSSQSNIISTPSGVRMTVLAGTVPQQTGGADGTTTFSIESGVTPPAPLPAGAQLISPIIKLGPEGFTFANTVAVSIPLPSAADPSRLRLLRYAPDSGTWIQYPLGFEGNSVNFAGYDLGYVALVLAPQTTASEDGSPAGAEAAMSSGGNEADFPVVVPPPEAPLPTDEVAPEVVDGEPVKEAEKAADEPAVVAPAQSVPLAWVSGGVRWNRTSCPPPYEHLQCWYNFSIISSTALPNSPTIYNSSCTQTGGALRCIAWRTGSDAGSPQPKCYHSIVRDGELDPDFYSSSSNYCTFPLPRGTYQFCVEAWEAPMVIPGPRQLKRWTYSRPARADVDRPMYRDRPSFAAPWIGTRPIVLEPGGTWEQSAACPKPAPTIPVGTGELQATLSWVNTSTRATDLDLHLYGPGGLHIYYANKGPQNNLRLDRDWLRTLGNATENIYSVGSPIPRGDYRLTVRLFSGAPTTYSVRFLFRGSVRSYTNSISSGEQEILRFTVP